VNSIHHDTPYTLWSAELGQPLAGPPLASGDLLLAPTQEPGPPSHQATLHALNLADGHLRWPKPLEYALVSGLAAAQTSEVSEPSEILILVATTSTDLMRGEGALAALDTTGEERWRWAPGVQRISAPTLVRSDDLSRSDEEAKVTTSNLAPEFEKAACVTCDARTFVVLDLATGEELTKAEMEVNASLSAPAVPDDVAYIPCRGPYLLAVGLDGETHWRFTAAGGADSWLDKTPVVAGDHLFAVLSTGAVLALRLEDGSLAWRRGVGPASKPLSPPATDGERLFVGARDGLHTLALDDGHELWAFPASRRITAAPVVTGGAVYVTCHDHHLYAIDAITGRELWRYEAERRIEVSPALAASGEPSTPCAIVADRGGTLLAIARPLSAAEHEAAGHWAEAASAYADLGQFARGAELLEVHGEPLKAAELWKKAGEQERAALQCEAAGAWQQAVELWTALGRPLQRAEALEACAQSLEGTPCGDEVHAEAWLAALRAFQAEGEVEQAATCQQEVARWRHQPIITMDVQHKGLVLRAWSRLQFVVRNEGYGPARHLVIHATGDEFEGQVMATRQITTLRVGQERTEWLDVRPLEHGDSVPLRVRVEYSDRAGEPQSYEHTIYIRVARSKAARSEGERIGVFDSRRDAEKQRERETASLRRQLEEARENLSLIEERKSQYVLEVDVPLQLIKEERHLTNRIAELEREVGVLEAAPPPLPATTHVLSFDRLSPLHFERLCLWLVEREGYTRAEHLGLAGSEQGRDVIAYRLTPHGEELWYFQCKRYGKIGARTLKDEVDKYLKLAQEKPHLLPAGVVFVVSCAVSAKAREEVGDYCDQHGLAYEFWALTELDMRVKRHPDLLREFFNVTS